MSNPNDPFPVPPEGAPPHGQPPHMGHPPPQPSHGVQPPQPPYGAPPPHQPPYGGPPQPPYGAPPSGNSKLLIGIIAGLVLVIVVGTTLFFAGAFDGRLSGSSGAATTNANSTSSYPPATYEQLTGSSGNSAYSSNSATSSLNSMGGSGSSSYRTTQLNQCVAFVRSEARSDAVARAEEICSCAVDHKIRTGSSEMTALETCATQLGLPPEN